MTPFSLIEGNLVFLALQVKLYDILKQILIVLIIGDTLVMPLLKHRQDVMHISGSGRVIIGSPNLHPRKRVVITGLAKMR